MKKLMVRMAQLWKDEEGATAVEYGLMVGLIAGAIIAVVTTLGGDLKSLFSAVGSKVSTATTNVTG